MSANTKLFVNIRAHYGLITAGVPAKKVTAQISFYQPDTVGVIKPFALTPPNEFTITVSPNYTLAAVKAGMLTVAQAFAATRFVVSPPDANSNPFATCTTNDIEVIGF